MRYFTQTYRYNYLTGTDCENNYRQAIAKTKTYSQTKPDQSSNDEFMDCENLVVQEFNNFGDSNQASHQSSCIFSTIPWANIFS